MNIFERMLDEYCGCNIVRVAVLLFKRDIDCLEFLQGYYKYEKKYFAKTSKTAIEILIEIEHNIKAIIQTSGLSRLMQTRWIRILEAFIKSEKKEAEMGRGVAIRQTFHAVEPCNIFDVIKKYIECRTEELPKILCHSGKNTIVDVTPAFDEIREAIKTMPMWQRRCWELELEKYYKRASEPSKRI